MWYVYVNVKCSGRGMPRVLYCFFKRTRDSVQRYWCVQLYDSRCTGISGMESVCKSVWRGHGCYEEYACHAER